MEIEKIEIKQKQAYIWKKFGKHFIVWTDKKGRLKVIDYPKGVF